MYITNLFWKSYNPQFLILTLQCFQPISSDVTALRLLEEFDVGQSSFPPLQGRLFSHVFAGLKFLRVGHALIQILRIRVPCKFICTCTCILYHSDTAHKRDIFQPV